ncbi:MAG: FAD:protein FMN transferase [Verrucomicrobiota bacterium]
MSDLSNNASIPADHRGVRSVSIHVLETRCRIQFRCNDAAASVRFVGAASSWLGALDKKCSRLRPDSLLTRINNTAGGGWVEIDAEMDQILTAADAAFQLTEGLVNPAALPLTRLWDEARVHNRTPADDEIRGALELSQWSAVRREKGRISLPRAGMGLDLHMLVRKYAVDILIQLARRHDIQHVLVQISGDLSAIGGEGESVFWKVGLEHGVKTPANAGLKLSNSAVSCSQVEGRVIDGRDGRPIQHDLRAVTVLAANSLAAGVHAAAMVVLGQRDGLHFAETTGMVDACLLDDIGITLTTRAFARHLAGGAPLRFPLSPAHADPVLPARRTELTGAQRWLPRDLIRLWPWLLPVVLLLITFGPAGLQHYSAEPGAAAAALGMVWMTFFITRRLWGHYRAHVAATMLMFTLGLFAIGLLPLPDMMLCFLNLAAIAALVHQRAWVFFAFLGLGLVTKGPVAAFVPASAALSWWFAGGRREGRAWLPGIAVTLVASLAAFLWKASPAAGLTQSVLPESFEGSWWRFLPTVFLALMPWSFCTPRVVRQGWRRLRTGTLQARHWLLIGWLFPALALTPGGLTASTLLLVPALIIAFCPPLADARRLWRIGTAALTLWMASGWALSISQGGPQTPSMAQSTVPARTVREVMPPPKSSALTALNRSQPISQAAAYALQR